MTTKRVLFLASVHLHLAHFHTPFMKLLQQQGCEVHAAASSSLGGKQEVAALGVTCWEVPFERSPYGLGNLRALHRLWQLMRRNHFDLIHVHTPVAAFLGRLLARATGQGKVIYTAHGFHFYKGAPWINWLVYYTAERIAARWTDALIVMNKEDLSSGQSLGFRLDHNLFFVPGVGLDLDKYAAPPNVQNLVRATLGIAETDIVVTCVAELNDNKNHSFLFNAWHRLTLNHKHIHLFLVGTGEMESALRAWVHQHVLQRVHFLGFRPDVPQVLWESDIAVLVSKREGLPRCIMEAMAASKPVVATNVRGSRDLVDDRRTGYLVELGDLNGLVEVFEALVDDAVQREGLGRAGMEEIKVCALENVLSAVSCIYANYLTRIG